MTAVRARGVAAAPVILTSSSSRKGASITWITPLVHSTSGRNTWILSEPQISVKPVTCKIILDLNCQHVISEQVHSESRPSCAYYIQTTNVYYFVKYYQNEMSI